MTGQKRDRAAANRAVREADWDSLRTRYEVGETTRVLAVEVGVASKTMQIQLGAHGTGMRTGTQPATLPVNDTDLRTAYAAGATITTLARKYGCSPSLIWRRLNFHTPPRERRPSKHRTASLELAGSWQPAQPGRESGKHTERFRAGTGEDKGGGLMAQRVTVVLEDDLDGTAADQTVAFSLDGTGYEIDLNQEHADQLRSALTPWIEPARHIGGRKPSKRASTRPGRRAGGTGVGTGPARTDKEQLDMIRVWANSHGHPVSDRGRIPAAVRDAFDQAHPTH